MLIGNLRIRPPKGVDGGPISEPQDAQFILKNTRGIAGFFGASSIERLPTEIAITDCVRRFKAIKPGGVLA